MFLSIATPVLKEEWKRRKKGRRRKKNIVLDLWPAGEIWPPNFWPFVTPTILMRVLQRHRTDRMSVIYYKGIY